MPPRHAGGRKPGSNAIFLSVSSTPSPNGIQAVEARHHLYTTNLQNTAGVEQAKRRRRAYGTHIKSVAEFSESWGAEISRGGCGDHKGGCDDYPRGCDDYPQGGATYIGTHLD